MQEMFMALWQQGRIIWEVSEEGKIFINKFNAQFGGQGMGRKNL